MDEFYFVSTKACQEQGYPRMGQALIAILCRPRDVHGPWVESGQPSRLRSTLVFDASLHQTLQGGDCQLSMGIHLGMPDVSVESTRGSVKPIVMITIRESVRSPCGAAREKMSCGWFQGPPLARLHAVSAACCLEKTLSRESSQGTR
jgi:hypothetical protein